VPQLEITQTVPIGGGIDAKNVHEGSQLPSDVVYRYLKPDMVAVAAGSGAIPTPSTDD